MLALFTNWSIIGVLHSNQYFRMSKRNKHNHNRMHKASVTNAAPKPREEENPITLDEHLQEMELQSMSTSSSDPASTTIAKADNVASEEVKEEEKSESVLTQTAEIPTSESKPVVEEQAEGGKKGRLKRVLVFWGGLLIGAVIAALYV
jgi:hypothetical protein